MKNTFAFSGFEKTKAAQPYALPLLIQGSPILTVLSGFVGEQTFTVATGRGDVYAVDVIQSQTVDYTNVLGIGGNVTLIAGGQSLFEGVSTDAFSLLAQPDVHARTFTPVEIAAGQTVRLICDQVSTSAGTRATVQQLFYYTNPEHSDFVKQYKRGSALGQKRTANFLRVNAGVTAGVFTLQGTIPRNLGPVNAVQVQLAGAGTGQVDLLDGFFTVDVIINGVTVIENVNPMYFNIPSYKRPQIFPCNIEPGATFEIRQTYTGTGPLALTFDTFLTFYYAN
jgi:hypothetical protein